MPLEALDFYNGLTALIVVIISVIVGVKLISKYFKFKNREYILVGLTWIFFVEPWWPPTVAFLLILLINETIPLEIYYTIGVIFIPFTLLCWLTAFTDLVYKEKQKIILLIFTVEGIIFEILFFYFLYTNPSVIVERVGLIDGEYKSFALIYLFSVLGVFIITCIIFAKESLKIDDPTVKLKAKFLILAIISFTIGTALDGLTPLNIITLFIYRTLVISSAMEFYCGFFLPERVKKLFLREK